MDASYLTYIPNVGKDWRQEEKGMTEVELVGWHHWLNGHEFEQILGNSEGQGRLACAAVHSIKKNQTQLSNWTTTLHTKCQYKYVKYMPLIQIYKQNKTKQNIQMYKEMVVKNCSSLWNLSVRSNVL